MNIYAVIKLVSGEEIFAQVEEFYEEDVQAIMAMDPCIIKEIPSRRQNVCYYKVDPWLKMSDDRIHCIELKHIIYYTRCENREIINTYRKWVKSLNKENEDSTPIKVGVSTHLGFVSSVEEARESLERIFKLKENS